MQYGSKWPTTAVAPAATSPQVKQFLDRTSGLDATHINAYTALIDGLVADGVWQLFDFLYIFATDTEANAKQNLKSSSYTITETGTVAFTADQGYTGVNASATDYLNTNFNPATAGGAFQLDSGHLAVWVETAGTANTVPIGIYDGANDLDIRPLFAGNTCFRVNGATDTTGAAADSLGHHNAVRTQLTFMRGYTDGALLATNNAASSTIVMNYNMYISAYNSSGTAVGGDEEISCAHMGGGMTDAQATAIYNRLDTYRTAVGL